MALIIMKILTRLETIYKKSSFTYKLHEEFFFFENLYLIRERKYKIRDDHHSGDFKAPRHAGHSPGA